MGNPKNIETTCWGKLCFASQTMHNLIALAKQVSQSTATVLITGESGTGKSLLAEAIHQHSQRAKFPFIAENCTAIAENLIESELFGHVAGAFTGAAHNKEGLFQLAHRGTLFLDEVGDMPWEMQAKLLRILETGSLRPVGASRWQSVNVRLVCATHRCLVSLVKQNKFREDLFYRLKMVTLELPPLRERPEDIWLLINNWLKETQLRMSQRALDFLLSYSWPGNIRQLKHELQRIHIFKSEGEILPHDLSSEILQTSPLPSVSSSLPLKEATQKFEFHYISQAITHANGNKTLAAKILGISRRSLHHKLQQLSGTILLAGS